MDIDGIALPHIVEHGLELGPVHTLAADFFGEPFLDAVLFECFDLAGFVLFFGADADICNFHGSTSLVGRKIGSEICVLPLCLCVVGGMCVLDGMSIDYSRE